MSSTNSDHPEYQAPGFHMNHNDDFLCLSSEVKSVEGTMSSHSRGARKTAYAKYLPFHCWPIPDIPVTGRRLSIIKKKNKPLNEILAQSPPQARLG